MTVRECDFLIVGGGIGGLAAAARATALGLDAVILEKSDYLGGVAAYSGGHRLGWQQPSCRPRWAFPTTRTARASTCNSSTATTRTTTTPCATLLMQKSIEAVEYYTETLKVPFSVIGRQDQYYPDAPGSVAAGRSLEVALSGSELGNKRPLLRPSPLFRVGLTPAGDQREGRQVSGLQGSLGSLSATREGGLSHLRPRVGGRILEGSAGRSTRRIPHQCQRAQTASRTWPGGWGRGRDRRGAPEVFHARKGVLLAAGSYGYPQGRRPDGGIARPERAGSPDHPWRRAAPGRWDGRRRHPGWHHFHHAGVRPPKPIIIRAATNRSICRSMRRPATPQCHHRQHRW